MNILSKTYLEVEQFFLKEESYFSPELPKYFTFNKLLEKVSNEIRGKELRGFYKASNLPHFKKGNPREVEGVNYLFLQNKDGKFAWRPLELIHPAIYVSLIHEITVEKNWKTIVNRFEEFRKNPKIGCFSIPVLSHAALSNKAANISNWWQSIEQKSIELALNYEYIVHTDISDCYGSIYTHSVAWALHGKNVAKKEKTTKSLIGNIIDAHLQDMSYGQTNGIPQGSAVMDFIAEMVLGYADLELSNKIDKSDITDYQILRYRDDYRVFTNNPQHAEIIIKYLTEILIELGMRLNPNKTLVSNNIIQSSIKPDKLFWICNKNTMNDLQQHLLLIHDLSQKFPNSGSLIKALDKFFNRIKNIKKVKQNIHVLISIIVDIAFRNPKTYPIASAILSKFLSLIKSEERPQILDSIIKRFDKIPSIGHIEIWLQRIFIKTNRQKEFTECLCKKVNDPTICIWNSDWLNPNNALYKIINTEQIIDEDVINQLDEVIAPEEVNTFSNPY